MKREEAIKELSEWLDDYCGWEELREAVGVAISALKAQNGTDTNVGSNGDTIYRQAAIDELYKMLHDYFWTDDEELDAIIATLNDLPSVQSEIIMCEDCIHNGSFDTDCPINWNGKEYCSFAERRTDEKDI